MGDDYSQMSFKNLNKTRSEKPKDFLESMLVKRIENSVAGGLVESTLTKLHMRLKNTISEGVQNVTPKPSDLKKINKKLQLTMAAHEAENTLTLNRAANLLSTEDYKSKKQYLADRLQNLLNEDYSDNEKFAKELVKLEQETLGEPTKSLIGKYDTHDKKNDKEGLEVTQQLIQKLTEDKRERKQRLKDLKKEKRERREKMRSEIERKQREKEEEERQKFESKKSEIVNKIESRKERIQKSKTEMLSETRKRVRKSPLHSKIESEFENSYVIPELQKRKQVLSQIRNFHQPIRLDKIMQHSEEKKELLKEKLKEFFKRREYLAECNADNRDKYNSHFWKTVKMREQEEQAKEKEAIEDISNRQQKRIAYAKNVMALYKPKVSKKKKLEMELIRKNMEDPHSLTKLRRGAKSTKHNLSMMSPTDKGISTDAASQITKRRVLSKAKPIDEKRYSYHPTPSNKHPFTKFDYLTKERIKKQDNDQLYSIDSWQNGLMKSNMTEAEKIEFVKLKSKQMEENLKWQEALMKANNNSTISDTRRLDGILIDSIKSKLEFITELH